MRKEKRRNRRFEKSQGVNQPQIQHFQGIARKVIQILFPGFTPVEKCFSGGAHVDFSHPNNDIQLRFSLDCRTGMMEYVVIKNYEKTNFQGSLHAALPNVIAREIVMAITLPKTPMGQALAASNVNGQT